MDLWAAKYRPALAAALEAACDKIEGDLASDVENGERERHAFLAQEVNRLEAENQVLRNQVVLLKNKQIRPATGIPDTNAVTTPARQPLGEIAGNRQVEGTPPVKQTTGRCSLEAAHARLIKKYNNLEKFSKTIEERSRHFRVARDEWVQYALRLEAKQAKLDQALERPSSPRSRSKLGNLTPASPEAGKLNSRADSKAGVVEAPARPLAPAPDDAVTVAFDSEATRDATQDDFDNTDDLPTLPRASAAEEELQIKTELSSDGPVVVSERSLGKRKPVEDHDGTPRPRIKRERTSSPIPTAVGNSESHLYSNTTDESMDLDAGGGLVPTPRKRRPADFPSCTEGTSKTGRTGPSGRYSAAVADANHVGRSTPTGSTHQGVLAWPLIHAGDAPAELNATASRAPETGRPSDPPGRRLHSKIAALAEDGSWSDNSSHVDTPTPGAQVHSKLEALLNKGVRAEERVLSRPTARKSIESRRDDSVHLCSGLRHNYSAKPGIAKPRNPTRLRERPLSDLRLDDFKINPKLNEGLEYAFDEVVRGRARRTDLLPCVDMNCPQNCGRRFRRLAEGELDAMDGSQKLSGPDGTRLMEEYLGGEAFRLGSMGAQEKREMWLEARTREMSDTFGTHRVRATTRMRSPPGYWVADFPSTQDTEKDRVEGQRMERQKVEERYKEALRGGGRWLFRDES